MKIDWDFFNIPRKKMFCRASLCPSILDYNFSFNLATHKKGNNTWILASKNFISGEQVSGLTIEAHPGQSIILLIKDNDGNQRRQRFDVDDYWVSKGDIGSAQTIADYKKLFNKK